MKKIRKSGTEQGGLYEGTGREADFLRLVYRGFQLFDYVLEFILIIQDLR